MTQMTQDDPLAAARRLAPSVAALRDRFDEDRRLPPELVEDLHAAGLFRLWLPRALGGTELAPVPFLQVFEELARQDGSVGWCALIPAGSARLAGAMEEDAARTIFGAGRGIVVGTLNPSGRATSVPGGYRVSGRWGYGSFIDHADWLLGNCVTDDGGLRLCFFPRSAAEVIDVWHVTGLRATGSNDYQVAELFVPERHSVPLTDFQPPARAPGPLYRIFMTSVFASSIAAVALGIARAAIEELLAIGAGKRIAGTAVALRDKAMAQADLARAEALLGSGRAYLFTELERLWDATVAGRADMLHERATVKLAACHATDCAIQAVDLAYRLAGGAALRQGCRLDRCFRDIHTAGQHVVVSSPANLETVGKVLFGLPPGTERF